MSKGRSGMKGMRIPAGGGGMMNQITKLQEEMAKTQAALGDEVFDVTAGGGAITVKISGHQKIKALSIKPEVIDPNDIEMLQDLIVAAINEAIETSQSKAAERLQGLTGGLHIPGLF